MAIIILRRQGIDDHEVVGRWEDGQWTDGDLPFMSDPVYADYDESMMLSEFNGPDYFATTESAYSGEVDL